MLFIFSILAGVGYGLYRVARETGFEHLRRSGLPGGSHSGVKLFGKNDLRMSNGPALTPGDTDDWVAQALDGRASIPLGVDTPVQEARFPTYGDE